MSTKAVLDHHLAAFGAGDVDDILADYTEDSVLVSPRGAVVGLDGLRAMFSELFGGLFAPGTYDFTLDAETVEGDVALIVWHATTASMDVQYGVDTFIVRDGKIKSQTFAAKMEPR